VKAGQHVFTGASSVDVPAIDLPDCSAKQADAAKNGSAKVMLD
jgi:type VI secretion system secreted protein VgrG